MYRPEFFTGVVFTAALSLGIQIYDIHTHVTTVEFQMSGIYSLKIVYMVTIVTLVHLL